MNETATPAQTEETPEPVSFEDALERVKTKCPTCKSSRQHTVRIPGTNTVVRHPLWGCVCEDSPHHGQWLMHCASCDFHELDTKKLEELSKPRQKIVTPPRGVARRLTR